MLAGSAMSERQFLEPEAKARATDVVRAVEALTAVEVVVAVRRAASRHLATSFAFGAVVALAGFAVMWLSPRVYDVRTMPLDAALAFVLGTLLAAGVPSLRRALTPRALRRKAAERAARRAFLTLGVERTRGRTGLLVYVALFERTVVIEADSGVPAQTLAGSIAEVRAALELAVRRTDLDGFLAALARLGPSCAAVLPRRADDENELCDHVA
jgi:putative membrane protein